MDICVLVNSTDSYSDCWIPFFTLLKQYWPDCQCPIILNSETKDFDFPGFDIHCTKTGAKKGRWGESLLTALDSVSSDIVLYLQEDYFLNDFVNTDVINDFVEFMKKDSWTRQDCGCIHLTWYGPRGPFHVTENPLLWEVDPRSRYRISLQASLWKTSFLKSIIRPGDSGWSLEERDSSRLSRSSPRVMTINRQEFTPFGNKIFPYVHTGIVRRCWNREAVEELFNSHDISIDFSIRGFTDELIIDKKPALSDIIPGICRRLRRIGNEYIDWLRYP